MTAGLGSRLCVFVCDEGQGGICLGKLVKTSFVFPAIYTQDNPDFVVPVCHTVSKQKLQSLNPPPKKYNFTIYSYLSKPV